MSNIKELLWGIVERTFDKQDVCKECDYFHAYKQSQPYGSTIAYEELCDCNVTDSLQCLGVKQWIEDGAGDE